MIVQKHGDLIIRTEQIIDEAYNRGKTDAKREISLSGEYTEANCGECHRRYYCEASPDSCIYAKIAQAESEKVDDEIKVGDEVIYQRKSSDPHNGEKGVVIGIGGNWREVRFLSNWSSVGVHKDSLIKTGRHFSQIEEVLKQMQEEQE